MVVVGSSFLISLISLIKKGYGIIDLIYEDEKGGQMDRKILGGIMGLVVGDALGVPVEFQTRESLSKKPVQGMRAYGTYNQPAGTWSDDSSMTLATMTSLMGGLDYKDLMDRFLDWYERGVYTPHGQAFDIGIATSQALVRYKAGWSPLESGGQGERDNGNGSLMRILPFLFYFNADYGAIINDGREEVFEKIGQASSLTHAHKRSIMACSIYLSIAQGLIFWNKNMAVEKGLTRALSHYSTLEGYKDEMKHFSKIAHIDFIDLEEKDIGSSGYVIDSLEASIWCLLNTDTYEDCVLRAVNLGQDTDTTAAIAGGLAGLYYGYEDIPKDWLETIIKRDELEELCHDFYLSIMRRGTQKMLGHYEFLEEFRGQEKLDWRFKDLDVEGSFANRYPDFFKQRSAFLQDFYWTSLMDYSYLVTLENEHGYKEKEEIDLDQADLKLTLAVFTDYIRQERVDPDFINKAIKDGDFIEILDRLAQLLDLNS